MSEKYYWWDITTATKMGNYFTRIESEFIDSFIRTHSIKKCLDIGCGSGRFTILIYKKGIDVIGVDIDPLALEILKEKEPNIKTLCLNASKGLPFENSFFDCIISIGTVDYFPDPNIFFKECNRILKHGGFLLFTLSNKHSYKNFLHKIFSKYRNFYRFSFRDIKSCIEKSGFSIEKVYGYNWIPCNTSSNSPLISVFEWIEKKIKLKNLSFISPWLFFIAKKNENSG